jgi:hypothetical protein
MNPDAASPGPHEINNSLINAIFHALHAHPSVAHKASYGQMLAQALRLQQQAHQAAQSQQTVAGGPAASPSGPASGGGYQSGQGLAPADTVDPSGGYVAQNVSPLQAAVIAAGGIQHVGPGFVQNHLFGPGIGGQTFGGSASFTPGEHLAGLLAQHVPLPAWAA